MRQASWPSLQTSIGRKLPKFCSHLALSLFTLLLIPSALLAQITAGSLSGTVRDITGAVIPKASVTLTNQATKDARSTSSNGAGYFSFAAVQAGQYSLTVRAEGFESLKQTGITLNSGDTREVTGIQLKVGSATQTVSVAADGDQIINTDSGTHSNVLGTQDLQKLSLESRNISELLKVLPGVTAVANGTSGGSSVDFSAVGPTGSTAGVGYSPSGAPYRGGTSFLLDGANIIDPGCNCWSIAVPNPDMTSEVKVEQAFGADMPNGPVVINTTSKSGAAAFHGQAYFYARNQVLNSNTWLNNHQNAARQPGQYYYPGGNIGGPVFIPHTRIGKSRNLFFWFGYEYYKQTLPAGTPLESYIPSAGMMAGNFTSTGTGNSALCPNGFTAGATNWCGDPTGSRDQNGALITNAAKVPVDTGAAALMKMFPAANADPSKTPGAYNYYLPYSNVQNGYVLRGRIDYNINANNKVYATFQQGASTLTNVAHVWWNPSNAVAYPGGAITQPTTSRVATFNMVNVLTPSLTNEFVFAWGWANGPYKPGDLSKIYNSTLGFNYGTVYNTASPVAPSINSAGAQTFPDISQPAFYNKDGIYVSKKAIPSFAENLTKVWKTHTFKFGAFTELVGNEQGTWAYPNGQLNFGNQAYSNNVTGSKITSDTLIGATNPTANLVMGIASSFSQNSNAPVQDMAYRTTSAYLLDNWQVIRHLTVNIGVRWDHVGRWYDRQGVGLAVWMPALYASDVALNQTSKSMVVQYPGIRWRGIDPGIPNSGSPTRLAFTTPRFGFSYDLKGDGQTVVRGGWGQYTWNDQFNDYGGALSTSQNMQTYSSPGSQAITLSQIALQTPSGNNMPAGSVTAADYNDYLVPRTSAWNLTIDRKLPFKSMLEIGYVGSSSKHLLMGGQSDGSGLGGAQFSNVNKIARGGLFKADPITGAAAPSNPDNTGTYNINDYYPYSGCTASGSCYGYGSNTVTVHEHVGDSNYHGVQIIWTKSQGKLSYNLSYTWSKSLGMIGSTLDAFNAHGNYGILSIDRPHVVNTTYSYAFGDLYKGQRKIVGEVVNGWNISGVTTFQSGGNLQAGYMQNLGLYIQDTKTSLPMTSKRYFGTDANSILPINTCNPKSGLKDRQKLNLSCFTAPTFGNQGYRQIHPYLSGPIYTDSDLTIYKTFPIVGSQNVEFRASAFDFLNHSLWGFSGNNLLALKYKTADGGQSFTTDAATLGLSSTNLWGVMDQKSPYSGAGYARIIEFSLKYNF